MRKFRILFCIMMSLGISSFSLAKTTEKISQQKTKEFQNVLTKTVEIKGAIIDSTTQQPILMGFVTVAGTNIGTITDPEGKFVIGIPKGAKHLIFSAKGYKPKKESITIDKNMEIKLVKKEK